MVTWEIDQVEEWLDEKARVQAEEHGMCLADFVMHVVRHYMEEREANELMAKLRKGGVDLEARWRRDAI